MLLVSLLSCLVLAGPEPAWRQPPSMAPRLIEPTHGRRKVGPPGRIVSLAPSATELVFALGHGRRVVGVTRYDDDPPEVKSLPKVGGFLDPNVEAVIALKPDLVLAAPNRENKERVERIAKLGAPVLVLPGNALQDLWWATEALAEVLGPEARPAAAGLLARFEDELSRIRDRPRSGARPRVAIVYGREPLVLAGPGSLAHQLLELASGTNVVRIDRAYPVYSLEQLVVDAPDLILDVSGEHERGTDFWLRLSVLDAVRQGRVITLTSTALLRVGPRVGEALQAIARAIDGLPSRSVPFRPPSD